MTDVKTFFRNENTTDTWLTPLSVVRSLGEFDLDPCGVRGHETAKRLYVLPETDGLEAEWFGRVWLNPPYGAQCGDWIDRLAQHGNGIALVFARVETSWFQRAVKRASAVLFPRGRISFIGADGQPSGQPSAPSVFLAFGSSNADALSKCGGWFVRINQSTKKEGEANGKS